MNLAITELKARLRHGMSQNELSAALDIPASTLSEILRGKRTPSEKTLKLLGLRRVIVYEYIDGRAPKPVKSGKGGCTAVSVPESATPVEQREIPADAPSLTLERIKVAVRYKLNPAKSWAEFMRGDNWTDAAWVAHCMERGTVVAAAIRQAQELYAPLGNGDAVRLKPVQRTQDFRPPLALGELPPAPVLVNVEVGMRQMAEAEARFKSDG